MTAWQAGGQNLHLFGRVDPADLYVVLSILGRCLQIEGNSPEAEQTFREALAWARKIYGNEHRDTATQLSGLGLVLVDEAKPADRRFANRLPSIGGFMLVSPTPISRPRSRCNSLRGTWRFPCTTWAAPVRTRAA